MEHRHLLSAWVATILGTSAPGTSTADAARLDAAVPFARASIRPIQVGMSSGVTPDTCRFFFRDYGDAPESFPAYPFLSTAHFPTCPDAGVPGTQEIECGSPASTPPGPTGHVVHVVGFDVGIPFWLGCGPHPSQADAGDGESTAKTSAGSNTSACGAIAVDCFEAGPSGTSFGQDECLGDTDAGVVGPLAFESCASSALRFRATVCPNLSVLAYANVLVDWNMDGDWNDNVLCESTQRCVREWAVQNQSVSLSAGCTELVTSEFQVGPRSGMAWMRVTLTNAPVPESFPWAGSVGTVNGDFAGGETEDYLVTIVPSTADVGAARGAVGPRLAPARPNPLRELTTIRYDLSRAGPVRVAVFDLAGRRLHTFESAHQRSGDHTLRWDGRDDSGARVPDGIYMIRLEAERQVLTQRLVVLR